MKQRLLLLGVCLLQVFVGRGQGWEHEYSADQSWQYYPLDYVYDSTGGIAILSQNLQLQSYSSYGNYVVRFNSIGDTIWKKYNPVTVPGYDATYMAIAKLGSDYFIAGDLIDAAGFQTNSYGISEVFLAKIDSNGNLLGVVHWPGFFISNTIATTSNGVFVYYCQNSPTGFIVQKHLANLSIDWADTVVNSTASNTTCSKYCGLNNVFSVLYNDSLLCYTNTGNVIYKKWIGDGTTVMVDSNTSLALQSVWTLDDSCNIVTFCQWSVSEGHTVSEWIIKYSPTGDVLHVVNLEVPALLVSAGFQRKNSTDLLFVYGFPDLSIAANLNIMSGPNGYIVFDTALQFKQLIPDGAKGTGSHFANTQGGAFTMNYYEKDTIDVSTGVYSIYNLCRGINFDSLQISSPVIIKGKTVLDGNQNCIEDASDALNHLAIMDFQSSTGEHYYAPTVSAGNEAYTIGLPPDSYQLMNHTGSPLLLPACTSVPATIDVSSPGIYTIPTLFDTANINAVDIAVAAYPATIVPGFTTTLGFGVSNEGYYPATASVKVVLDPNTVFVSAQPGPASIANDTLTFNIANLQSLASTPISIDVVTPATANLGDPVTVSVTASFPTDQHPENNTDTLFTTVVGSFDPNDKSVNRPLHFDGSRELVYKVRFQNTGTYPAKNVLVVDTLDPHLDMSSFKLLSASPAMPVVSWHKGNRLFFNFENIYLPDSNANEPASHGEFVYSVQAKSSAQVGDTIRNTAYIYFDYNAPVITNTTMNILSAPPTPQGVGMVGRTEDISVYPVPARDALHIRFPESSKGSWQLSLQDLTGRNILRRTVSGHEITLPVFVPDGMYFLWMSQGSRQFVRKVEVRR